MRLPSRLHAEGATRQRVSEQLRRSEQRRSEAGDTLVEVLLAIIILGIASVSILLAFATTISGSAEHRTLTTADTVLRTAAEQSTSLIQQQSSDAWGQCPSNPYSWLQTSVTLSSGYTEQVTGVSYWSSTQNTFVPWTTAGACTVSTAISPQVNSPVLITITVTSASGVVSSPLSFVVDDPFARPIPAAGTATHLAFFSSPATGSSSTVGSPFGFQPVVAVEDANNNIVTTAFASVTLSIGTGPNGSALSNCTATQFKGVVTFAGCSVNMVGTYTLTASETGLTSGTSSSFYVAPAPPYAFSIISNPLSAIASSTANMGPITVQEQDMFGNPTTTAETVNLSSTSGTGVFSATPGGAAVTSITIPAGSTSANFYYGDTSSGTPTITVSGTLASDTQSETVTGGPATHLVFTTSPSSTATGGSAFGRQPVVVAEDVFGNASTVDASTVNLAITGGTGTAGASLNGCTESESNGVFTFSGCSINKIGSGYTLTATDGLYAPATSSTITVSVGPAAQLAFTTQPVGNVAESTNFATSPKVTVQDAGGNTVTTDSNNVTLGIASYSTANSGTTQGTLACSNNTVSAVAGVASFTNCKISGTAAAGTYTLTATRSGLSPGTSSTLSILAGTSTKLAVTTQPTSSIAGTNFTERVSVEDSLGNVVTTSSASISLAMGTNPGGGTLTCAASSVNASSGVSTFTCSINKTGTGYTLTATSTSLTAVTSSGFNITPGAAASLVVTTQPPTTTTSGIRFTTGVSIEDSLGNVVTTSSAPVSLAIANNPSGGTLSCATTPPINASSGVATFSCSVDIAGTGYTLTATSTGVTSVTTNAFNNVAGAGTQLQITSNPINTTASSAATSAFTVTLEDNAGNPTTKTSNITVNLSSTSTGKKFAATSGGATATSVTLLANNQTVVAYYADTVAGNPTITAAASGLVSDTQVETVTPGSGAKLVVTTQPTNTVAGTSFTTGVSVEDSLGNIVPSAIAQVSLAIANNPGTGTLSCTTNPVSVSGGVATFSCSINKTGSGYTLTATSTGLTSATTAGFNITPGAAASLVVTTQPTNTVDGTNFTTGVSIEDALGNVTTSSAQVSLAIAANPGGGTLTCTTNPVNASGGVATFTCSINKTGTGYTLTATSTGLPSVTTNAFNITPGAGTQLLVSNGFTATASSSATTAFNVTLEDTNGNPTTKTTAITVNLTSTSGGAKFATTSGGASATSVSLPANTQFVTAYYGDTVAGTPTIMAAATGLTSDTQIETINAGAGTQLLVSNGFTATANSSATTVFTVTLEDTYGNPTTRSSAITVNLTSTSGGAKFATSSAGASATSVTLPANSQSVNAYYGDTVAGTPTIMAAATGLTSDTQIETINAGAGTQLAITSTAIHAAHGSSATNAFTVTLEDSYGNYTTKTSAITVTLSSTSSGKKFATTSGGASVTTVSLPANTQSVTAYYGDSVVGSPTITVGATGLTSGTQIETMT